MPVYPVSHLEGHIMSTRLALSEPVPTSNPECPKLNFPFLSLLVSGKHTEIILTRGIGLHTVLGMTIDVAAGNVFDRAGTLLLMFRETL